MFRIIWLPLLSGLNLFFIIPHRDISFPLLDMFPHVSGTLKREWREKSGTKHESFSTEEGGKKAARTLKEYKEDWKESVGGGGINHSIMHPHYSGSGRNCSRISTPSTTHLYQQFYCVGG